MTLVGSDIPLVSWESSTNNKIYSSRWNGTAFTSPITINPAGVSPFIANWAGAEIASSGDTAFIVFSTVPADTGNVYTVRTIDGGVSFEDTVRVTPIDTANMVRFPSVAVAPGGNPIVNYMQIEAIGMLDSEWAVARSTNGGSSYLPPTVPSLLAPDFVCDCCPATIAISGNRQALVFRNNDSNIRNMWAAHSIDAGASFPVAAEVDQTNWMIMSCPSSGPSSVIIGDTLYTTWMSDATGDARIYLSTTNINDQQIGTLRQIYATGTATQNFPVIAGKGDTLGIAWQGYVGSLAKVYFTASTSGAAGLGAVVDTVTKTYSSGQSRPDLAFANGKFHMVFTDGNGSNVKYLTGSIGTVGVQEYIPSGLSFNAFYNNGSIQLSIKSTQKSRSQCAIYNSMGQLVSSLLFIPEGEATYSISAPEETGIYVITITGEDGKCSSKRVLVK
jgi:hypothetical protein